MILCRSLNVSTRGLYPWSGCLAQGRCYVLTVSCRVVLFFLTLAFHETGLAQISALPLSPSKPTLEFSGRLIRHVGGRTLVAQLFVKGDRYRLEHLGGVKTELGYAGISIVRRDKNEVWFLVAQRHEYLAVPLKPEHLLPFEATMEGETERTLIGDAEAAGRPAQLFEVSVTAQSGQSERYFQWIDVEWRIPLKIVSTSHEWSVEYERLVFSKQPGYYFDEPIGYRRWEPPPPPLEKG